MIARFLSVYGQPRIISILFLGFSSGLPLALTASTLAVWLAESGISNSAIGLFAAAATPYALKFLWSPVMDGTAFPVLSRLLGRRRGWLMATQLALVASILLLGLNDPVHAPWLTAAAALLVAICSASQDIVVDAYRVEILPQEQQGAGAAAVVLGYRLGMIASSAGALFLATYMSWFATYAIMAACMGVGMATVLLSPEPDHRGSALPSWHGDISAWLRDAVVAPFVEFMQRDYWLAILLLVLLYKLADAFMGVMTNPFLIDIGFSKEQIATVVKLFGVAATIFGSFVGGSMVLRLGVTRTLWICGIAHAMTNLMFVAQARMGADTHFLALSITLSNVSGGMGASAFVAFISGLANRRFTATQYALLSSLAAFGRTWLSTPAGWCADRLGWPWFFVLAAFLAVPGLAVLWWLTRRISLEKKS